MKKNIAIFILGAILLVLGVSFAYYRVQIIGTGSNVTLNTKYLRIVFTDTTEIVEDSIIPGWETSKTFTVENKFEGDTSYDIIFEDFINTFVTVGNLQYKIVSLDGGYNTVSDDDNYIEMPKSKSTKTIPLVNDIELLEDAKHTYTFYIRYKNSEESQTADMLKTLSGRLGIEEGTSIYPLYANLDDTMLKYHILRDNDVYREEWVPERASFNTIYPATDSDSETFFKTKNAENNDTVFYYAGNATNNWVIFGKCPTIGRKNCEAGDDLYWRIIRTNEKSTGGGIRLLYSGSGLEVNESGMPVIKVVQNAYIGSSNWYATNNKPNNVGYTKGTDDYTEGETTLSDIRGNAIESNIKIAIDNWYLATFHNTEYESLIDTQAVYCNDRSTTVDKSSGLNGNTIFGSRQRVISFKPSYACGANITGGIYFEGNDNLDKYTSEVYTYNGNTIGNGYLTKVVNEEIVKIPAALMTADEVVFAGGKSETSNSNAWYHLNANTTGAAAQKSATPNQRWWTISPGYYLSSATAWTVNGDSGFLSGDSWHSVTNSRAVRPAISLKSNTKWLSGNGTPENPYIIKIENE